jgi:hypothetical protein
LPGNGIIWTLLFKNKKDKQIINHTKWTDKKVRLKSRPKKENSKDSKNNTLFNDKNTCK